MNYAHLVDVIVVSDDAIDYGYNVQLKKEIKFNDFILEMNKIDGISNINLVTAKMDVEY